MNKFFAAMVIALGLGASAQGAIIVNLLNAATQPPSSTATGAMAGHTALIIQLENTGGTPFSDVNLQDGLNFGINAKMHQRWTWDVNANDGDGGFVSTPDSTVSGANATTATNVDSHVLVPLGDRVTPPGGSPTEDNNTNGQGPFTDVAASVDYGYGSFLKGHFGIAGSSGSAATNKLNLAYIVVPNNVVGSITGEVSVQGNPTAIPFSAPIAVPEPGSLSLLGLAAAGFLARRRTA